MAVKKRTWGQLRADKQRKRKEAKGVSMVLPGDILDNRICFRASRVQRELSCLVQQKLQLTQGELFRTLLLEKAANLGINSPDI